MTRGKGPSFDLGAVKLVFRLSSIAPIAITGVPRIPYTPPPSDLAISLLIGPGAALATTIVGAISIFRRIDGSAVVVLATALGLLATLFFLGELLSVVGVLPSH